MLRKPVRRGTRYKGFLRRSPNLFRRAADGELILELLSQAERQPVSSPVDPTRLARRPLFRVERRKGKSVVSAVVGVPETEEAETAAEPWAPAGDKAALSTRAHGNPICPVGAGSGHGVLRVGRTKRSHNHGRASRGVRCLA